MDIKSKNLVKGINYEGLIVLGNPNKFSKYYYDIGADEIIYHDLMASLHKRNTVLETISETVKDVFVPITVGGGLKTIEDISNVLKSGADKVFINTEALRNIKFIEQAVKLFGSSTIVICIETAKIDGEFYPFVDNARDMIDKKTTDWILEIQDLGVGEILLSSIDNDGTGIGFDLALLDECVPIINTQLVVHGGAGKIDDIIQIINDYDIDGISISSLLHYSCLRNISFDRINNNLGNTDFIDKNINFTKFENINLSSLKKLISKNIKHKSIRN